MRESRQMSSRQSLPHGFVGYKDLWLCRCWLRPANDAQSDGDNFLCIDSRFGISGLELGQGERVEFSDESVGKSQDGHMGQLCCWLSPTEGKGYAVLVLRTVVF